MPTQDELEIAQRGYLPEADGRLLYTRTTNQGDTDMGYKREHENFPSLDAAKSALEARGSERAYVVRDEYRRPDPKDQGCEQRAYAYECVPANARRFGRVAYWTV